VVLLSGGMDSCVVRRWRRAIMMRRRSMSAMGSALRSASGVRLRVSATGLGFEIAWRCETMRWHASEGRL